MAKLKNIRQKRPAKRFRIPSGVIQWGIVGIVAVVLVMLVASALTRPSEPAPIPLLASAKTDLISVTRMLGDVALDSSVRALFPPELVAQLAGPDSLYAQRRWFDAIADLSKLLKGRNRPDSAAINAYIALSNYQADNLDRSLLFFRKSLAADSSESGIAPRLEFFVGWLFQSKGYQDSAVTHYSRALRAFPDTARLLRARTANNAGVAYEVLKNRPAAEGAYQEAASLLDTAAYPKDAETIRENIARLARAP